MGGSMLKRNVRRRCEGEVGRKGGGAKEKRERVMGERERVGNGGFNGRVRPAYLNYPCLSLARKLSPSPSDVRTLSGDSYGVPENIRS